MRFIPILVALSKRQYPAAVRLLVIVLGSPVFLALMPALLIRREVRSHFGSFRLALLWLHSFEEPFLNAREMVDLGNQTKFLVEGTRFTGALCCLVLRKRAKDGVQPRQFPTWH